MGFMEIRFQFTRTARKHRISKGHAKESMANAVLVEIQDRPEGAVGLFIGTDSRGLELEIGIAGTNDDQPIWLVIHVMPTNFRK